MPAFLRDCDVDGVDVCGSKLASGHFADDGPGVGITTNTNTQIQNILVTQTTATRMHLEGHMDDARRKFNVENKATVIMC
jgi:hypothetical protein